MGVGGGGWGNEFRQRQDFRKRFDDHNFRFYGSSSQAKGNDWVANMDPGMLNGSAAGALAPCSGFGMANSGMSNSGPSLATALEATVNFLDPLPEERQVHAKCIQQLETIVKQVGKEWEIQAFGSAMNGFLSRGADLDVSCFKNNNPDQDSQLSVQELKYRILPLLRTQPSFKVTQEIWSARVPIIHLRFLNIIDVDLSCHNPQALQNTHLLRAYAELSPLVRQLVLCVKFWAKGQGVCGAPKGYLSSYSFSLLVIYFLQVDQQLPCLPVEEFGPWGPMRPLHYEWICRTSLSELLFRFFSFYAQAFSWGAEVVSIRVGRRKLGSDPDFLNLPGRQAQRLHVEDPFLPRNLNCVLSTDKEEHLRTCMQQAFLTINSNAVPQVFLEADPQKWLRQPDTKRAIGLWRNPIQQQMLPMPDYETQEMAQMLPYPAVRPAQVSRLNARSKPFQAPAELPSRTIEMRFEESRANAIEDSKIRAMTEPRITVTDGSASKTATPGIKAMEEAKVLPTNGNNIRAFQDQKTEQKQSAQEPAAGKMSTALAWLNGGDAQEEEPETQPVPVESSVPWTRLAGGRVEI